MSKQFVIVNFHRIWSVSKQTKRLETFPMKFVHPCSIQFLRFYAQALGFTRLTLRPASHTAPVTSEQIQSPPDENAGLSCCTELIRFILQNENINVILFRYAVIRRRTLHS
jgi:hypothetical protein